jgi:2-succinyl-6-hydroxy-2,4-cyclohexadiene-1-carboxylate synthase
VTRPLVLLHGFTGAPGSWARVVDELTHPPGAASAGEVLAPAVVGHDGTPGPPGVRGFEDEVDRLAATVRDRGLVDAHLVGYSMGGRLALGLLVRHPELFAAATLIGASPGLADAAERADRVARDEEWARLLDEEGLDTFVAAWEALPIFATQAALAPDVLGRQRRVRRSHDPRGLARSLRAVGLGRMPDYRPRLPDLDRPIRLVAGERDPKFRGLAAEMAERLPRAEVTVVPAVGHNVVLEAPSEISGLLREDMTR